MRYRFSRQAERDIEEIGHVQVLEVRRILHSARNISADGVN